MARGPTFPRSLAALAMLALASATFPTIANAQYFGRNKVQYESFGFRILKTEHFDVYYYPEEEEVVRDAARMAERWYARLSRLLDHQLKGRQPLILYASHPHFEQTNAIFGEIGDATGGVTEVLKRRIVLPLAGPLKESDHVIGHELVHAFQFDITSLAGSGGVGFRGPTALLLPLWVIEGMAEYLSLGPVDPHTAMWMRDAASGCCKLPTLEDLTRKPFEYFPYRWGQAFWAYVAGNWGDEAVGKVLKVAGRSGNVTQALEAVLQTSVDSLEAEWHRSIVQMYASVAQEKIGISEAIPDLGEAGVGEGAAVPEEGRRAKVDRKQLRKEIAAAQNRGARELVSKRTGGGGLNVGPALSPDGQRVAFLSEKDRFSIEMFVADAETGRILRRLTKTATDPHYQSLQFINSAGAWSRDGRQFAFAVVSAGRPGIAIVDPASGRKIKELRFDDLGEVYTPTFSPDGGKLAFAAIVDGYTDLFIVDVESGDARRLTNDRFADLQPAWSPDGSSIAFVTDRFSADLERLAYGNYRIAVLDVASGEIQALPVFGSGKHIDPQWSRDGQSLYFVTDASGIPNVYRYDFRGGGLFQVTDLVTGVSGITALSPVISTAANADRLVYTAYEGGDYDLYVVEDAERLAGRPIQAAIPGVSPAVLPPPDRSPGLLSVLLGEPELGLVDTLTFAQASYRPGLSLDFVSQPQIIAGTDRFGSFLSGGISMFFSDMLGNRNLATVINVNSANGKLFRSSALLASYTNLRSRLNWGLQGGQIPFVTRGFQIRDGGNGLLIEDEIRLWQINREVTAGISYPFSRASRVELSAGLLNIDFASEVQSTLFDASTGVVLDRQTEDLPAPPSLNMAISTAALVYDNTIFGGTGPILGQRYRFEVSPRVGSLTYYNALVDYRRYFMFARPTTFALRLLGFGRFGGDAEDTRLSPLYLGFPSLIRGYNDSSFSFDECEFGDQGITSCSAFDQLFGSRIAVANFEYRIPLLGFFGLIPSAGAPPIETALFFDAGVAWTQDIDPRFSCSQADLIASKCREVVTSHGIALRMNLLGLLLLETDFVHPNNRPRGWYWQFSLVPAF